MDIEQLKSIATVKEEWVEKEVSYTPAGADEEVKFSVLIKNQATVEDFEAIQGLRGDNGHSFLVEQVVRLVRFGEKREQMTPDVAEMLDYRLLLSIGAAIREVSDAKPAPKQKS